MISINKVEEWVKSLESRSLIAQKEAINAVDWPSEHRAMARSLAFLEAALVLESGLRDYYKDMVDQQLREYSPKWDGSFPGETRI